jgi:hypothetical protein
MSQVLKLTVFAESYAFTKAHFTPGRRSILAWISALQDKGIKISMDGKGSAIVNAWI